MKIVFDTKENMTHKRELISLMLSLLINKKNHQYTLINGVPYKISEKEDSLWILDNNKEWSIKFMDTNTFEVSYENTSLSKNKVQELMKNLAKEVSLILDIEGISFKLNENEVKNESIS